MEEYINIRYINHTHQNYIPKISRTICLRVRFHMTKLWAEEKPLQNCGLKKNLYSSTGQMKIKSLTLPSQAML